MANESVGHSMVMGESDNPLTGLERKVSALNDSSRETSGGTDGFRPVTDVNQELLVIERRKMAPDEVGLQSLLPRSNLLEGEGGRDGTTLGARAIPSSLK